LDEVSAGVLLHGVWDVVDKVKIIWVGKEDHPLTPASGGHGFGGQVVGEATDKNRGIEKWK
jgi:hypothetical protein